MSLLNDAAAFPQAPGLADTYLQRTLREQQVLLDSAGAGIVFIRQRQVVRCNHRYAEIFGYGSHTDLAGIGSESFYPHRSAFKALGRAAFPVLSKGQSYRTECTLSRRDGTLFLARLTGSLIDSADPGAGSIWIVDDINDQSSAQAQLDAALWEKQVLFDNAMVGIVYLRERQLTRCNRHFERMLGYGEGELVGSSTRRWYGSEAEWEVVGRSCYRPLS